MRPVVIHLAILLLIISAGVGTAWLVRETTVARGWSAKDVADDIAKLHAITLIAIGSGIYVLLIDRKLRRCLASKEEIGPYMLKELLGAGGMGDVYLAEHRLLKRLCAIKLVRQDKANSKHLIECFEQEVKATAQLTHWNTVQVYDYGRTRNGSFYYAMEYLQGLNLLQMVDQFGPMPAGRVTYILRQICGSLHEAATRGLVHRDIKPSNIFLAERGQMYDVAKLLDFGLVSPASDDGFALRNVRHQLQGSPRYMCPEQARGLVPDCRGDLYSLGCVAYFLLTGRPPFDERNPVLVVLAHGTQQVPTFAEIGADVPADLSAIIMKCLKKEPVDRFSGPRELEAALRACDCVQEWSGEDAELWWQQHARSAASSTTDSTHSAADTVAADMSARCADPDPTFVCLSN